jgi:cephalosporin hydroxylase
VSCAETTHPKGSIKVNEVAEFFAEVEDNIAGIGADHDLQALSRIWLQLAAKHRYSYNFTWLGRPIIQHPTDVMALQEIIWSVKPDLIIETGVAHGGSLIFSSSMLELLGGNREVLGIDIEIREHNRNELLRHPMSKRIKLLEGSSTSDSILEEIRDYVQGKERVLVILDSNHSHDHVLRELELYSPFVRAGSYLIVLDTVIEDMPEGSFPERPWGKGNNPKTAVHQFLRHCDRFEIDHTVEAKLLITVGPDGYLKCVKG